MSKKPLLEVIPPPPSWLSDRAKEIYHETFALLGVQGIASDSSMVSDYAQAQADCDEWVVLVRWEGEVINSAKTGALYTNPRYVNLQARRRELYIYREALGFNPRARGVVLKSESARSITGALDI